MRRATFSVLGVLLLAGLPGCLEMEQTITIAADGSGGQQLRLSMSDAVIAEVKRATAVATAPGSANPLLVFDEKAVRNEVADAGLQLQTYKIEKGEQKQQVQMAATFANLEALRKSPLLGPRCEWEFAKGEDKGTIRIALYPQGKEAWVAARQQAEKLSTTDDPVAADFFRKRQTQLEGLDVKIRLVLPGRVLRWTRTLERTGVNEVTASVQAAQLRTPEDLVRKLAPRYEVVIDATGVTMPLEAN